MCYALKCVWMQWCDVWSTVCVSVCVSLYSYKYCVDNVIYRLYVLGLGKGAWEYTLCVHKMGCHRQHTKNFTNQCTPLFWSIQTTLAICRLTSNDLKHCLRQIRWEIGPDWIRRVPGPTKRKDNKWNTYLADRVTAVSDKPGTHRQKHAESYGSVSMQH